MVVRMGGLAERQVADATRALMRRDTDLAAVVTYTKNSWSNKTGQVVQPAEFVAARK
jgi:hypothetical protein